jgi:hypothetical protein
MQARNRAYRFAASLPLGMVVVIEAALLGDVLACSTDSSKDNVVPRSERGSSDDSGVPEPEAEHRDGGRPESDASRDVGAEMDAGDATVDVNACGIQSDSSCGPNPTCCTPLQGYRFHADLNCIGTSPTALSCLGVAPCTPLGQATGCFTRNGDVFFVTEGGTVLLDGFEPCSSELNQKVMQAPRDAGCPK